MRHGFKRFIRKSLAIVFGLMLGWVVADAAFDQVPAAAYGASAAAPPGAAGDQPHEMYAIEALKPVTDSPLHGKLVKFAILLFVAAVALGPVAQSLKAPEPPERDEHHGHDAHGGHGGAPAHGGHGHH